MGGASYLAAKVKKLRSEKPTLLLSAGDMIQGSNWANLTEGKSVIELMNAMQFDAMVVGNHDFDFGKEVLKKRISEEKFPVLSANVQGIESLKPFIIRELSGIKIAIIGVVTEETPTATHPKNIEGLRFESVESTLERFLGELKGKVDLVIALSHIGFHADRLLTENLQDIDVIVGGHSHTKVETPAVVGHTIISQAWEHGKALGILDLTIENGKIIKFHGYLEEISPETASEEPSIKALVEKYSSMVNSLLDQKIGVALIDLDGENVRKRETNLGNFIADDPKAKAGNRIRDIFFGNELLKPEKEYIVSTNDFLVAGGNGYKAFSENLESSKDYTVIGGVIKAEKLVYSDASRYLRDIVVDYIKKKGILEPKTEGRIREVLEK